MGGSAAAINGALSFSGGGHVELPAGIVSGLDSFTLSFWVKPGAVTEGARVFDFSTADAQNSLSFTPRTAGGQMRFSLRVAGVEQIVEAPSSPHFTPDVWTRVAVTLANNTARLYVNGVEVASNPAMTNRPSALGVTTNNFIGKSASSAYPAFNGAVDEFRIYQGAVSATDVVLLSAALATPSNVVVTATSLNVDLSWGAVPGAIGYTVRRATSISGPYTVLATIIGTSFTDTSVLNDTTYYYTVMASNGLVESSRSVPVGALPSFVRTHLRFNHSSGTTITDSSGRGWHGTVVSTSSWTTGSNARMGSALRLNGGHATLPGGHRGRPHRLHRRLLGEAGLHCHLGAGV